MNTTSIDPSGLSPFLIALRTYFIAFIGLLIISGNILSIAVTRHVSTLADSTKVLMTSLAVYDLLIGFLTLFSVVASAMDRWPFGDVGCEIYAIGTSIIFYMSGISVIILNIQRFIAVTWPYKFPVWCSRRRVITLVLVASTLSLFAGISTKFVFQKSTKYIAGALVCLFENITLTANIFKLLYVNMFPTLLIIFIYCRLIQVTRNHKRRLNQNGQNEANNVHDNKTVKTAFIVTLTYAGCSTPLRMVKIVESYTGVSSPDWLQFIVTWLAICNSIFNVYIYCLFNQSFRQIAKKIISERLPYCNRSVAPVDIEL